MMPSNHLHSARLVTQRRSRHYWLGAAISAALALSACGSSGGDDDDSSAAPPAAATSGVVVGSYFANAVVCLDANGNGHCDAGEPAARSDDRGAYTLNGAKTAVVAEIGTDAIEIDPAAGTRTPVSRPLVLRAPAEAPSVASFHSTSVVAAMEILGLSFDDAVKSVGIALGVPAEQVLADFNQMSDEQNRKVLSAASDAGIARLQLEIEANGGTESIAGLINEAARTDRYYQTKAPYRAEQDAASYEVAPAGYSLVYTQLVARHGSRGLSSLKYDLAVYNMWKQAEADDALTPLGKRLGADVLRLMKANFLLGYGVDGISTPGYGNESQVGIQEHQQLAKRMLQRQAAYWKRYAGDATRQVLVVSSGQDRAVDSANYFAGSLKTTMPALVSQVVYPAAPSSYPEGGTPVAQPAGTDRFTLYFHKLDKKTDLVQNPSNPFYQTYQDSLAYQAYKDGDSDLLAKLNGLLTGARATAAGQLVMSRLFTQAFIDKIANGTYSFANTGTFTFTSDDGKFSPTLSGNGKTKIDGVGAAASLLYELYVIAPAMVDEAQVDFTPYMPADQAKVFAELNDASDFYEKGPGLVEKGTINFRMAQSLVTDFFNEVDRIEMGDLSHAAKLRFSHAEIMIPLASQFGLKTATSQVAVANDFAYASNPWRGDAVSPMAANMQWDVYADQSGKLIVKMLYNEKETDFKSACDTAKVSGTKSFYDYDKLKNCYQHNPAS